MKHATHREPWALDNKTCITTYSDCGALRSKEHKDEWCVDWKGMQSTLVQISITGRDVKWLHCFVDYVVSYKNQNLMVAISVLLMFLPHHIHCITLMNTYIILITKQWLVQIQYEWKGYRVSWYNSMLLGAVFNGSSIPFHFQRRRVCLPPCGLNTTAHQLGLFEFHLESVKLLSLFTDYGVSLKRQYAIICHFFAMFLLATSNIFKWIVMIYDKVKYR